MKRFDGRHDIVCLDFGLLELKTPISTNTRIYLKHFTLSSALPKAVTLASTYRLATLNKMVDTYIDYSFTAPEFIGYEDMTESPRALLLAFWLSCFEAFRMWEADPANSRLTYHERVTLRNFMYEYLDDPDIDLKRRQDLPAGVGVVGLDPLALDPSVLEWASEALGFYLAKHEPLVRLEDKE